MTELRFGDEVEPISSYADDKKRKYIFMSWSGNKATGYAQIATLCEDSEAFDENGIWGKISGWNFVNISYVHKKNIIKKGEKK